MCAFLQVDESAAFETAAALRAARVDGERVARLEEEVGVLRRELAELREQFAEFKKQFE